MKQYTNSKGESLPKVICAVVDFEHERLGFWEFGDKTNALNDLFKWSDSNVFGTDEEKNSFAWRDIYSCNYDHFYSIFPTCKNSRGQELPEEIQVEIVEERLRLGKKDEGCFATGYFNWLESAKGSDYWSNIYYKTDYTPTELPTKSDDTFTQGEIVEVSDREDFSKKYTGEIYLCFFNGLHWTIGTEANQAAYGWKHCRKIQPLELTLPELLTIAEEVKGTKVKLKS